MHYINSDVLRLVLQSSMVYFNTVLSITRFLRFETKIVSPKKSRNRGAGFQPQMFCQYFQNLVYTLTEARSDCITINMSNKIKPKSKRRACPGLNFDITSFIGKFGPRFPRHRANRFIGFLVKYHCFWQVTVKQMKLKGQYPI